MTTTITRTELLENMLRGDDLAIVEALPPMYYHEAHVPRALNMPHDQVDSLAPRLFPNRAQAIVVHCSNHACQNSRIAANRLTTLGYTNVRTYEDGKQDWMEAGLPTARAPETPSTG
jgi:rhodanese-related sulfurtransferase